MKISQASTFASHPIQIGCLVRLGTERTDVRIAHVVYEDHDRYRGTERRDILLMNKTDRERLGLKIDQLITVSSSAGSG